METTPDSSGVMRYFTIVNDLIRETPLYLDRIFTSENCPDWFQHPLVFRCLAIAIVVGLVLNIFMAPVFFMRLATAMAENGLKKNKLNKDDVHYSTLRSVKVSICRVRDMYKYFIPRTYFVSENEIGFIWIVGISMFTTLFSYILVAFKDEFVRICAACMAGVCMVMAILNSSVYNSAACSALRANQKYTDFNAFCAVNTPTITSTNFMRKLTTSPKNTFEMEKNVEAAFGALQDSSATEPIDVDILTKALFTTNLYVHFCKIDSYSNIANEDDRAAALNLFEPGSHLSFVAGTGGDPPAFTNYLYSKNTMIYNYCKNVGLGQTGKTCSSLAVFSNCTAAVLTEAHANADALTNQANGMMQSFDPEANFNKLLYMAIALTIIQTLPLSVPFIVKYFLSRQNSQ